MANVLKVAVVHAIIGLLAQGWSYRRIARELGVHRETVSRYDRLRQTAGSKPANVTAGSNSSESSKPANATAGYLGLPPSDRSLGPPSRCQPYEAAIKTKLDQGLSAQRIYQDIVVEESFEGSYSSVKRFVRRLGAKTPLPFRRMECEPGYEARSTLGQVPGLSKMARNAELMFSVSS
ncbi:MAG: hypothetical protein DRP45_08515 [Candidatus Zixiibacteriota bacterium]|nr:MAG: hypothetical protein DRP45_08515 [candidate division Zixibacteria bacterium]